MKEQLATLTGIPVPDQVIILCDLNDVERNSDTLLNGREYFSLRDCGIVNGSILTLHALGMNAELKQKMTTEALNKLSKDKNKDDIVYHILHTPITAAQANHR